MSNEQRANEIIKICLKWAKQDSKAVPDIKKVFESMAIHSVKVKDNPDLSHYYQTGIHRMPVHVADIAMKSGFTGPSRAELICEVHDNWKRRHGIVDSCIDDALKDKHPVLRPAISAARECDAIIRDDRILPIIKSDNRLPDLQPPAPLQGDLFIPAMEIKRMPWALPLQWFTVGFKDHDLRGRYTPVEQRLIIEVLLATAKDMRDGIPTLVRFERQYLFSRLFPSARSKHVDEIWARVMEAFGRLSITGIERGGQVYKTFDLLEWPKQDNPHGEFIVEVNVPEGDGNGPKIPANLHKIALVSAVQHRLLLNLAHEWHDPGRTHRKPKSGKHWPRVYLEGRYRALTDDQLLELAYPVGARRKGTAARRKQQGRVRNAVDELVKAGEVELAGHDGRILMPPKKDKE